MEPDTSAVPGGLAERLDHTLLRAGMTDKDVARLCREALAHGLRGVCIPPAHLPQVVVALEGSDVLPITVVAFPLGLSTLGSKLFEALEAVRLGAAEIDVVLNVSLLKAGDYSALRREMSQVMEKTPECRHKFIIELGLLDRGELRRMCRLANELEPAFIKTSTGSLPGAVSAEEVARLRELLRPEIRVKAAGGIRTLAQANAMVAAGADVIGTSSAVEILGESTVDSYQSTVRNRIG